MHNTARYIYSNRKKEVEAENKKEEELRKLENKKSQKKVAFAFESMPLTLRNNDNDVLGNLKTNRDKINSDKNIEESDLQIPKETSSIDNDEKFEKEYTHKNENENETNQ